MLRAMLRPRSAGERLLSGAFSLGLTLGIALGGLAAMAGDPPKWRVYVGANADPRSH
jgi:hypothetical protein